MRRATTPTHTFSFSDNPENYDKIVVAYCQGGKVLLKKTKDDMTFSSETEEGVTTYYGSYQLTQEETLLFKDGLKVEVQVRAKQGNDVPATAITAIDVKRILDEEIL